MSQPKQKIASLELMRVIAMIAVIVIHVRLFIDLPAIAGEPWLADIANQLARFAVPFFFLTSGYLIQPKLTADPYRVMRQYNRPLLRLWLVWSVICLLLPSRFDVLAEQGYLAERMGYWQFLWQTPLNTLFEGGLVHLWFLPSLMIAVAILAVLLHSQRQHWLLPLALVLYVYGVLAGSYSELSQLSAPIFTRNGPFFSLLMVALGFEIRRRSWSLSATHALLLGLVGLLGHFAEAFYLYGHGVPFAGHDFLFFTVLWGVGLFMWLLAHPSYGDYPWVHWLSRYTLAIYVCHLSIAIVLFNLVRVWSLEGLTRDGVLLFGTYFGSLAFVLLVDKSPLRRWLLR
ncbi:acyltransferase [Motilimonas sp. KMU-193]|uniref:acyltransferase n=1 Tax=Motilimonas sp. KMU-193 TaxID=3388668 RepID=UPI00396AF88F